MIVDVEIYNSRIRQVKELSLTAATLEETLKYYKYSGEHQPKEDTVEHLLIPPIALVFYSFLFDTGTIPSDTTLVEEYFKHDAFAYIPDGKVEVDYEGKRTIVSIEGLTARVLRTYPSLVRDLHFYLLLKESGIFDAVRYSFKADYYDKVDIKVQYKSTWYNIGLMLGSKRSLGYKIKKVFRHKPINTIDIELYDNESQRVGDYNLYTPNHINKLLKQMKSK